jgi:hypothetical protein
MIIMWTSLYSAIHFFWNPKTSVSKKIILDTKNRIVSIIYGLVTFVVGTYIYLTNDIEYMYDNVVHLILNSKLLL